MLQSARLRFEQDILCGNLCAESNPSLAWLILNICTFFHISGSTNPERGAAASPGQLRPAGILGSVQTHSNSFRSVQTLLDRFRPVQTELRQVQTNSIPFLTSFNHFEQFTIARGVSLQSQGGALLVAQKLVFKYLVDSGPLDFYFAKSTEVG